MPEERETVTIDLSETDVPAPEQPDVGTEWCIEAEYYAATTDEFDRDAVEEELIDHPLVIDAWVTRETGVEWDDHDGSTHRVKVNCWVPGGRGNDAARAGFATFGEWTNERDGVEGVTAEFCQSVGKSTDELDVDVEFET